MRLEDILKELKSLSVPENIEGMARFGITAKEVLGVSVPNLRNMARRIGKDHNLAMKLWKKEIRETRLLAGMIDDPAMVTEEQMNSWVEDFDSWEICDGSCMNLFEDTAFAYKKCFEWSGRDEEFVKRAGFVMMARMAVSDKKADDRQFEKFFPIIKREAVDERNFVRKAVNWALRQIGKRNLRLNGKAVECGDTILKMDSKSARWIATDALRELRSDAVLNRLSGDRSRNSPLKKGGRGL